MGYVVFLHRLNFDAYFLALVYSFKLRELGTSSMSYTYGISGLDEAKAYLAHPVLSERLYELCGALLEHKDKKACEILGDIDTALSQIITMQESYIGGGA